MIKIIRRIPWKTIKNIGDCQLKIYPPKVYRRRIANFLFLLLTFSILHQPSSIAEVRYVSPTGNNIPPYLTWGDAANKIQDCINVSEFGDTIYVANGIYEEQVVMIPGLSLIGAGTDSCIIDTRALITSQNYISVEVADICLIKGFYILCSTDFNYGYGIYSEAHSGLITSNKFSNANTGIIIGDSDIKIYKNFCFNVRRGINAFNSNSIIRKNDIITNSEEGPGGGISIGAFNSNYMPIVDSNYIETRTGKDGIRKSFGTRPTITNNTIIMKLGTIYGIQLSISDSANVHNNTIISVGSGDGINNSGIQFLQMYNNYVRKYGLGIGIRSGTNDNIVKNNIVTNANIAIQKWFDYPPPVFQYNNLWNNNINTSGFISDTTNLFIDPMIVNDDTTLGELDFHLQAFSPMIDAGDPEMIDKDSSRIDIGLYGGLYGEVYKYQDLPPRPPRNLTGEIDSGMITIRWNPNTEIDFSHYKLFRDTIADFTVDSTTFVMSLTDTFYTHIVPPDIDKYYYKLTAVDNQGNESLPSEELAVIITSITTDDPVIISSYILYQNYPNPFNPKTTIAYKLKEGGYVKLYVYSVSGELISVLVNQHQEAGYYEVEFGLKSQDSNLNTNLASGVYIYQVMVKNENDIPVFSDMKKMLLIK